MINRFIRKPALYPRRWLTARHPRSPFLNPSKHVNTAESRRWQRVARSLYKGNSPLPRRTNAGHPIPIQAPFHALCARPVVVHVVNQKYTGPGGGSLAPSAVFEFRLTSKAVSSDITLDDLCIPIFSDLQLRQLVSLLNDEALLVGQMQQTDEAEAGRDVIHHWLGVDLLQAVHDIRELERWVLCRGWWRLRAALLCCRRRWHLSDMLISVLTSGLMVP